jgi:hypothetical protein
MILWPWPLWLTYLLKISTLTVFWMVCTRTLIFCTSDEWPYHESQQILPCDLNLDIWPAYWKLTLGMTFQSYVPGLDSLSQNLSIAIDVTTVIKQVIWRCELSIWPIFQKLSCRHGFQRNFSRGAFVFHKHILLKRRFSKVFPIETDVNMFYPIGAPHNLWGPWIK